MISVSNVSFSYTGKPFLEHISFEVNRGEIFGFLGPSGAGKSTLQKILTGLLPGYGGSVVVNGVEARNRTSAFYEHIGVDFEFPSLYGKLTARQNLAFFASLYKARPLPFDDLFAMVHLEHDAQKRVNTFSKGMKSRLNFIKALVHDPDLLFLDEPTSGLDPSNSFDMKNCIRSLKAQNKTIILTTHNMHDAAELCDRVAFIADGRVKALDTPRNLIMSRGAAKIRYTYQEDGREKNGECRLENTGTDFLFNRLVQENRLLSVHSGEPSLSDIFMEVTGRVLQ